MAAAGRPVYKILSIYFHFFNRDMHQELCGGRPSLCEAMKPTKGSDLLMFLKKVKFTGITKIRINIQHSV